MRALLKAGDLMGKQLVNAKEFGEMRPNYEAKPKRTVRNEFDELRAEVDAFQASVRSTFDAHSAEIESLKTDHASLKTDYASLKTDYASLKAHYASLKTDYASLKTDYASLKTDYASLKTDYASFKTKIGSLEEKIESLHGEIGRSSQIVAILAEDAPQPSRDKLAAAGLTDWAKSNREHPKYSCAQCKVGNIKLKCVRCRLARYCSEDCQKAHWPIHKELCHPPPSIMSSPTPDADSTPLHSTDDVD